jgi:hypothetical protein
MAGSEHLKCRAKIRRITTGVKVTLFAILEVKIPKLIEFSLRLWMQFLAEDWRVEASRKFTVNFVLAKRNGSIPYV